MTTDTLDTATITVDALGEPLALECFEAGSGDPLLLLHGASGFRASDPYVAALAERHRVIAPSHPGYGATPRPEWLDTVTDRAHFHLELLEQRDLRDVTIVGLSLGGWIAAEMAAWRSERIARLVLIDPVGIRVGGPTDRDIVDIFAISAEERARRVFHDPAYAGPPPAELPSEELVRRLRAEETTALYAWEPYMCNPKLRRRLRAVRVPALVVWGEHDGIAPVGYGHAYAESFPDARFEVVAAAGHSPHVEQPATVVELIERFLSETSSGAAA